jgi:hypothetical protein
MITHLDVYVLPNSRVLHFYDQLDSNVLYFASVKSTEEPNFVYKIMSQSKNKYYESYYQFCFLVVRLGE